MGTTCVTAMDRCVRTNCLGFIQLAFIDVTFEKCNLYLTNNVSKRSYENPCIYFRFSHPINFVRFRSEHKPFLCAY